MSRDDRWNLRRVFRLPSSRARVRADVEAELEFHIRGRADELIAQGMPRDAAECEARRRFGDYARIEAEVEHLRHHAERRATLRDRLEALAADVRYAARSLARQPLYVGVVLVTLTLGIGGTAAIFHAIDRIVLHPLPYPDADRLVYLGTQWGKGRPVGALAPGRFQFWYDNSRSFESLASYRSFEAVIGDDETGSSVNGISVSTDFPRVTGATALIGRTFTSRDYDPAAPPVAVLGHGLWVSQFGGDRAVIARTVRLDGRLYTIVGVLQPEFEVAELPAPPQVMVPLRLTAEEMAELGANYTTIGRLRPGMSQAQIAEDMASVFAAFRRASPAAVDKDDFGVALMTYEQVFAFELAPQLWITLGATAFVFLLACANVSNIVYARSLTRQRELAVRAALGAGRARIVRQLVVEMTLMGIAAAALASAASLLTVRSLVRLAHTSLLRDSQLHLDPRVVFATTVVALVASVGIGVLVALAATRADLTRSLAASTRATGIGTTVRRGARGWLVSVEAALAMVLLAGAGLLISSFIKVLHVDGGFRREGIYTAALPRVPRDYSDPDVVHRFEERVLEELRSTPGILSAGATATLPLRRGWNLPTTVEGRSDLTQGATEWRAISPGYLRTMDIQLIAGRDFAASDAAGAPYVTLVSESYAEFFFNGVNPIGRRILIGCYKGCPEKHPEGAEIIGIVRDLRDASLEQAQPRRTVWVPLAQVNNNPSFVVRAGDPAVAASALRRAIASAEPRMGVPDVAAMSDIVSASMSWRRFSTVLLVCFAGLALVLTCIGIYGVAAYGVSQRVQEIGLRIALGARPQTVVALIVRQGVQPAAVGLVIGLAAALGLSRVLTKYLFGVTARDPLSFASVSVLLVVVAAIASYLPARRAAHIDPIDALRVD